MINRFFPNWESFAFKYQGREQDAFENLARTLFRKELGLRVGLFQRMNQKGNETTVVEKDGKVIGFQAKFFKDEIDENNIIHSMKGAKEDNPKQTHYYIYCNLSFGEPKPRKGSKKTDPKPEKTLKEEKIDNAAAELGLTLVWKMNQALLDEANEEYWIYDVFFNVEGKLENLVIEESKHTRTALASIGYSCSFHNQVIHVNRNPAIKRLEDLPVSSIFVIHGDGGCGKTAILHEFLEMHHEDYPVYYRKASVLNVQNLAQVFHQGNLYAMEDFINAYKSSDRKYFIIDSAEHLEEIADDNIIPLLIQLLLDEGWCVVFTVRTVYLSDLLNYLSFRLNQKNVPLESVEPLTEHELVTISRKYGIQLPTDSNLRDRLRNLFYLNLYTQFYDEMDSKYDELSFMQLIWEKKIKGNNKRRGFIRENEFESFIEEKLNTGKVFLSPNKYTSEEFYSLIEDEVIALDPINGLFITHDIFEEWGLYRLVEKAWQKKISLADFFASLGETRFVRRTFRIWLKDKVGRDVEAIKPLAQDAFTEEILGLWKDEVLCAVLTSDKAKILLSDVEGKILDNTDGFRDKVIWALRVGSQYVREVIKVKDFYWPLFVPIGSGWKYIIDLLYQHKERIDLTPWLPVLQDWTKSNYYSETTRKAGLMVIEYYLGSTYHDLRYHDGVKKQVCEIINNAIWVIRDEVKDLLQKCVTDKRLCNDLPMFALSENTSALNIQMALPDVVADLCLFYWKDKEDEDDRYYHPRLRGSCFGIDEDRIASRYFPPGARQTPTFTLLVSNEKTTVDFIIRLVNECVEIYARLDCQEPIVKVDIKDENGVSNWQWHNGTLWGMYRGMGAQVSYTLQSVHMALEQYLLNLSKEEKFEHCKRIMRRLLFESHSSSLTAVVASLVLAYPDKYWREALVIFRTAVFFATDNQRALNENEMESFYGIGYTLNPDITKERLETCKQEFRKKTLETVCLDYQFFGNQKELNGEQCDLLIQSIYGILDEHRKLLDKDSNQTLLEIQLSRMDRRRLRIKEQTRVDGGLQIQFDTELGEEARKVSDGAAVDQQEMFKYLGLLNWAMAKMMGETPPNHTFDDDWTKALIDAKTLQKELEEGRVPFLTDTNTTSWVAPCLLKFYIEELSSSDLKWCKRIVEQKLDGFKCLADVMDGTTACIHVVPRLIEFFPEEKDKYFAILLRCLLAPDYGNNLSSRECVIAAVRTFDLWAKESRAMHSLVDNLIECVEADERLDDTLALNIISGIIPDNPDEPLISYTVSYLKRIPKLLEDGNDTVHAMFSVIENLAHMFLRVNNKEILDCLEYSMPIVKESYLGDAFLSHIIIEADRQNIPDRFWLIWNSYRDSLPDLVSWGNCQQLRTYLLNIQWNDGIKEWRCLKRDNLDFFAYVADNFGGNAVVLECIAKALNNIAHAYQTEGMEWIAKAIVNHPTINLAGTNALFYLEQVLIEYVYANKMQIRKKQELHEQIRSILSFMVNKNSVTGFVLRDLVS